MTPRPREYTQTLAPFINREGASLNRTGWASPPTGSFTSAQPKACVLTQLRASMRSADTPEPGTHRHLRQRSGDRHHDGAYQQADDAAAIAILVVAETPELRDELSRINHRSDYARQGSDHGHNRRTTAARMGLHAAPAGGGR